MSVNAGLRQLHPMVRAPAQVLISHAKRGLGLCLALWFAIATPAAAQQTQQPAPPPAVDPAAPIRLTTPASGPAARDTRRPEPQSPTPTDPKLALEPTPQGEFQRYVQRQAGPEIPIKRLGADLMTAGDPDDRGAELSPVVPSDYPVSPGDEVLVTLWGSVDADLRLIVDRSGNVTIPRVGAIRVAGVRNSELTSVIERRVSQVFRGFQLSVSLGQLRGIRVFVTGFVARPGTYAVSSLATLATALMRAGGPTASGSFRRIELRRSGTAEVVPFDLYDLLLKGERGNDRILQAGDVVHVAAIGPQVGVIGSVNQPSIVELKPGETVVDAIAMAGGFAAMADRSRVAIERLRDRQSQRIDELPLPSAGSTQLSDGDLLRVFSATEASLSVQLQNKRVRVEGEVARPGEYVLPPNSTLHDALRAAGGLTPSAYLYGTQFSRESVRIAQQINYERALRDLEVDLTRANAAQRVSTAEDAVTRSAQASAGTRLIERLRGLQPSGRVVLQLVPGGTQLPDLLLEDGDRLLVPPVPTSVGVFGSVFNGGSYLHLPGRSLGEYLTLAGGPTKGADRGSVFVVRANGQVVSNRQGRIWFGGADAVGDMRAEPGDTIFVPEEMDKTTFVQAAKDWTQILFNFGIGLAGIKSAVQ